MKRILIFFLSLSSTIFTLHIALAKIYLSGDRISSGIQILEMLAKDGAPKNKIALIQLLLATGYMKKRQFDMVTTILDQLERSAREENASSLSGANVAGSSYLQVNPSDPQAMQSASVAEAAKSSRNVRHGSYVVPQSSISGAVMSINTAQEGSSLSAQDMVRTIEYLELRARCFLYMGNFEKALYWVDVAFANVPSSSLSHCARLHYRRGKIYQGMLLAQMMRTRDTDAGKTSEKKSPLGDFDQSDAILEEPLLPVLPNPLQCISAFMLAHDIYMKLDDKIHVVKCLLRICETYLHIAFVPVGLLGLAPQILLPWLKEAGFNIENEDAAFNEFLFKVESHATSALEICSETLHVTLLLKCYITMSEIRFLQERYEAALAYWYEARDTFCTLFSNGPQTILVSKSTPGFSANIKTLLKRLVRMLLTFDSNVINHPANLAILDIYIHYEVDLLSDLISWRHERESWGVVEFLRMPSNDSLATPSNAAAHNGHTMSAASNMSNFSNGSAVLATPRTAPTPSPGRRVDGWQENLRLAMGAMGSRSGSRSGKKPFSLAAYFADEEEAHKAVGLAESIYLSLYEINRNCEQFSLGRYDQQTVMERNREILARMLTNAQRLRAMCGFGPAVEFPTSEIGSMPIRPSALTDPAPSGGDTWKSSFGAVLNSSVPLMVPINPSSVAGLTGPYARTLGPQSPTTNGLSNSNYAKWLVSARAVCDPILGQTMYIFALDNVVVLYMPLSEVKMLRLADVRESELGAEWAAVPAGMTRHTVHGASFGSASGIAPAASPASLNRPASASVAGPRPQMLQASPSSLSIGSGNNSGVSSQQQNSKKDRNAQSKGGVGAMNNSTSVSNFTYFIPQRDLLEEVVRESRARSEAIFKYVRTINGLKRLTRAGLSGVGLAAYKVGLKDIALIMKDGGNGSLPTSLSSLFGLNASARAFQMLTEDSRGRASPWTLLCDDATELRRRLIEKTTLMAFNSQPTQQVNAPTMDPYFYNELLRITPENVRLPHLLGPAAASFSSIAAEFEDPLVSIEADCAICNCEWFADHYWQPGFCRNCFHQHVVGAEFAVAEPQRPVVKPLPNTARSESKSDLRRNSSKGNNSLSGSSSTVSLHKKTGSMGSSGIIPNLAPLLSLRELDSLIPPALDISAVHELFEALDPQNIILVMGALFGECRLIFSSSSQFRIRAVVTTLLRLMYPFQWQHTYIPLLSIECTSLLEDQCPYVIGVNSYLFDMLQMPVGAVVVDLDRNSVVFGPGTFVQFPRRHVNLLRKAMVKFWSLSFSRKTQDLAKK